MSERKATLGGTSPMDSYILNPETGLEEPNLDFFFDNGKRAGRLEALKDFWNRFLDNIEQSMLLLGWKGGCGCELWKDDNKLGIALKIQSKRKKPSKKVMNKIKGLFVFDDVHYLEDGHSIVLEKALEGRND
jgi:hypothetical protein